MATNTQKVRVFLGKKRCGWCFSLIDEETGRCTKMCPNAIMSKRIDAIEDEIIEEKRKKAEEEAKSSESEDTSTSEQP